VAHGPDSAGIQAETAEALAGAFASERWIRGVVDNVLIVDSRRAQLVREPGRPPVYYFPMADVRMDLLEQSDRVAEFPSKGPTIFWDLSIDSGRREHAAILHTALPDRLASLAGHVSFRWQALDAWYEEDEQVYFHPRDPMTRVDVLPSSRLVRIELDGVILAESRRPHLLFETDLPTRYYLPSEDVRLDLLAASDSHTGCPYKGTASYFHLKLGSKNYPDFVWTYLDPLPEAARIGGMLAFYNEKVDLYVDGELQPRPKTRWSS
jgi:uncharacterized protein (DUF427 family)